MGMVLGLAGGYLVTMAIEKGLMRGRFQWIGFLSLAVISYAAAIAVGGSGFIAAFVGGFATTLQGRGVSESIIEFTSTWGEIFSFVVFFIFGIIAASLLPGITAAILLCAVLSLTLIRILPGRAIVVENRIANGFGPFYRMVWSTRTWVDCPVAYDTQRSPGHTRSADDCGSSDYYCSYQ
ncbi:MAG: hypothetical protein LUQ36_00170 [Methanoregula sp.]|nr:hypothetical protein [Methanoregula sp.]